MSYCEDLKSHWLRRMVPSMVSLLCSHACAILRRSRYDASENDSWEAIKEILEKSAKDRERLAEEELARQEASLSEEEKKVRARVLCSERSLQPSLSLYPLFFSPSGFYVFLPPSPLQHLSSL